MTPDTWLTIAGIGVMLAVPLTFMVANWVRKNVDHGELRFDTRNAEELTGTSGSTGPARGGTREPDARKTGDGDVAEAGDG